jgi:hypothetical protein
MGRGHSFSSSEEVVGEKLSLVEAMDQLPRGLFSLPTQSTVRE